MKIVIAFGRFNPPSKGHRKLAQKMKDIAIELSAFHKLWISHSYDGIDSKKFNKDKCKNPLKYEDKFRFVEDALGDLVTVVESDAINIYKVLEDCYRNSFTEVYIIAGSDRLEGYEIVKKYNKEDDIYHFDKLEIISAGERDIDSEDIEEQASASLLRQCVKDLDYDKFEQYAGTQSLTEELFDTLMYEMGINENV